MAAPLAQQPLELAAPAAELAAYKLLRARFLRSLGLASNTWPRAIEYMDAIARASGVQHAMRYLARVIEHNARRFQGDRLARVSFGAIKSYAQRIAAALLATGATRDVEAAPASSQEGAARRPASAFGVSLESAKRAVAGLVERAGTDVRYMRTSAPHRSVRSLRRLLDLTPDLFPILPEH